MYDVYLQRRAVLNEMREMAARPFAQVQLSASQSLLEEQPQPVSKTNNYKLSGAVLLILSCVSKRTASKQTKRQQFGYFSPFSRSKCI